MQQVYVWVGVSIFCPDGKASRRQEGVGKAVQVAF